MRKSRVPPGFAIILILIGIAPFNGCGRSEVNTTKVRERHESPRIASLASDLENGRADSITRFWDEIKGKAPLVESIPGNEHEVLFTFVYRDPMGSAGVKMAGGLPAAERVKPLGHLEGSDLWYRTERLPKDARFLYAFLLEPPSQQPKAEGKSTRSKEELRPQPDPLNPRSLLGSSIAQHPEAPPDRLSYPIPSVPAGKLRRESLNSKTLGEMRPLAIYTPPGYSRAGDRYSLLIVLDGQAYGSMPGAPIPLPIILDNLIADRAISPVVAVLVDNLSGATRNRDLTCSEGFTDFLAKELVPWLRSREHVGEGAERVIVCGSSFGGLCAAYSALRHPDVFGNVLSQSGSFQYYPGYLDHPPTNETETGWLTRRFVEGPGGRTRFFLEVGRFEQWPVENLVAENRRLRDVLEAKGYEVSYLEYSGGHDCLGWRLKLADGLVELLNPARKKEFIK